MHNPESIQENETHKVLWDFEIQKDHQISARQPDLDIVNKKQRTCQIMDFAVLANHRVKLKEGEKRDKFLDIAREQKNYGTWKWWWWPIVIGALSTVTKGLVKGLEELEIKTRVETIQISALLRSARLLRRVLETLGDLQSLKLQWKAISWSWCEKLSKWV